MKVAVITGLLGLVLLAAPVQSQEGPNPDNATIWAHQTNDPECCSSWMSTLKDDPAQTLDASTSLLGTPDSPARPARSWTMELVPELGSVVTLDRAGTVDFVVYLGGGLNVMSPVPELPSGGSVTVTSVLMLGDQVVAEGEPQELNWAGEWVELVWSIQPAIEALDPARGNLVWTLKADGVTPAISFSTGDTNGRSRLTLPFAVADAPAGIQTHYADLVAATTAVSQSFTNATSDLYYYNWTSDMGGVNVTYDATIQNGSALLTVVDGAGATLLQANLTADFGETQSFPDAADGNWTIAIDYADFVGNFSLSLGPYVAPTTTAPPPTTEGPAPETEDEPVVQDEEGSNPVESQASEDEQSPGLGVALVLVLLGVAMAARRR